MAGRKGERAAQRIDRRQARHRTQLRAIEHRRDARADARLANQHVDIEQRVTAQIDILQPGGVGAELRVLTQPRQRLLRAAGDAPGQTHGATARVPLGTRRDQLERPDLPAVDRRMHARAVPLDARIQMLHIGPGIGACQGRVAQPHSAPELGPAAAPGRLGRSERSAPLEIRARDAPGDELGGRGAERGQRAGA